MKVNWRFLLRSLNSFLNANVKLENFIIDYFTEFDHEFSLLNKLYDRKFYKRLQWYQLSTISQKTINELTTIRGLDTIYIHEIESGMIWPVMNNIKQIFISMFYDFDVTTLPPKLPNLERIYLNNATMDIILAFTRGSINLKEIFIEVWSHGTYLNEGIIDVSAINNERAKLAGACKIIIYIDEVVFLATKFKHDVKQSFIEIKRKESKKSSKWNFKSRIWNYFS